MVNWSDPATVNAQECPSSLLHTGLSSNMYTAMNSRTRQISACSGRHIHVRDSDTLFV